VPAPEQFDELRTTSERLLVDFLENEVRLGSTFLELAATERELGNMQHSHQARHDAEEAVNSIRRFLVRVNGPRAKASIERDCEELARSIEGLNS